ncbi:MAG: NUDIX domain-containing protein [Chitinophagales bacterium]|nr:NUDIX domain-containing protein [Chitinophagales bacterium]
MIEHTFQLNGFTIRVYGILIDDIKGILISDEFENGKYFTKFPGGGLELGEGIKDCLIREWKEELQQSIEVLDHFYTTDFFQRSSLHTNKQVISVYYFVKVFEKLKVKISDHAFDFHAGVTGSQSFRWISFKELSDDAFTFEIDKVVARKLIGVFKN